ncbi:hypothetical protein GCM10023331_41150 [Algivirga pacifica]|uniref:Deaminase n=2 Tax=Algivirga pacifica TaxID=1162670 RepID=A0ABP9DQV7_9BACT
MLTPYQFATNNPILNIDLDGLEGVDMSQRYLGLWQSAIQLENEGKIVSSLEYVQHMNRNIALGNAAGMTLYTGGVAVGEGLTWISSNYVNLLYNPILQTNLLGGAYGIATGDEALFPTGIVDETTRAGKYLIREIVEDIPYPSRTGFGRLHAVRKKLIETYRGLPGGNDFRTKLKNGGGNLAYAEGLINNKLVNIDAVSGTISPNGTAQLLEDGQRFFKTKVTKIKGGVDEVHRYNDSEAKIFESIAHSLVGKPGTYKEFVGNITIYSNRTPCMSCRGVKKQFQKMFPNINVEIIGETKHK